MSKRSRSISSSPSVDRFPETPSEPLSLVSSTVSVKKHLLDTANPVAEVMHCSLPPHRETLSFPSYDDYEVHYRQTHVNRCAACGKNFPTDRFLNLHIEENHDSLTAAKRERGEKTVCRHVTKTNENMLGSSGSSCFTKCSMDVLSKIVSGNARHRRNAECI
jgi:hypothetical protein